MSEAEKTIGIFTGVLDVYVARYATEDTTAAAPTYDPPKVLGASIEVTITPQYAEATLEASNRVGAALQAHQGLQHQGER